MKKEFPFDKVQSKLEGLWLQRTLLMIDSSSSDLIRIDERISALDSALLIYCFGEV